jgi:deoxyribodipyrimidine photo-lyase
MLAGRAMAKPTAIWWIRRDLRIHDNKALLEAVNYANQIVPIFILDDRLINSRYASQKRFAFLLSGLQELNEELRMRGGYLCVRRGDPVAVLSNVVQEVDADVIFAEEDFTPFARTRDTAVSRVLPLLYAGTSTVSHPRDVVKGDGNPYTVFTPYSKRWRTMNADVRTVKPPDTVRAIPLESVPIPEQPDLPDSVPFVSGHHAAMAQLHRFTEGADAPIYRYSRDRDRLDLDATSRLSSCFRFGMLSAREAVGAARNARANAPDQNGKDGADSWLNEIIWREFYASVLYHFPHVRKLEYRDQYRDIEWLNDPNDLVAWREARTGYPIIDACMRQLHAEGWMHNRGRMITASFLVKHLLVDWRLGEEHFMQHLVDGDPASNNGNWQWIAGTGTDAAPYFRIFNPVLQSKRHDPDGVYIRRWLPQLREVNNRFIHEPWLMSREVQDGVRCRIGLDYPEPIIDHRYARERALAAYRGR